MNINLFKKQTNQRIDLVETLIYELDDLYNELWDEDIEDHNLIENSATTQGNESHYRRVQEHKDKIQLRKTIIEQLLK